MRQNMKYQDLTLLLVHHYCTSIFLFHKKVQSQRFALQELFPIPKKDCHTKLCDSLFAIL